MKRLLILTLLWSFGCESKYKSINYKNGPERSEESSPEPLPSSEPTPEPTLEPTPAPTAEIEDKLFICPTLDFSGMRAPADLEDIEINAFALALNISSTFEGDENWKNITNNFDGMGLSLGLLNQTLGTGSLQPLLLEMLEKNEAKMKSAYSDTNFLSIQKMILDWKKNSGTTTVQEAALFAEDGSGISDLDEGLRISPLSAAESTSVSWALKTIYTSTSGKTFKTDWKLQLQNMCMVAEYRSLQFEAARTLHNKALLYYDGFEFTEFRSYLFLFDIVVQNGGLYESNWSDYQAFLKKKPNATEKERLYAILESRLKQVRSQYRNDVKARKTSLIEGHGKVHGTTRNYETEYCYSSDTAL